MPDDVTVEFDFSELKRVVDDFVRRGGNMSEVNPVIAEDLVAEVVTQFEKQASFSTGPWPELADGTIAARRQSKDPQMLKDTDNMFGSITAYSDDELAEAYTNVPYSKFHVSDQPRKKGPDGSDILPRRDFTDIDLDSVAERAADLMLSEMVTTS